MTDLQFDRAVTEAPSSNATATGVTCSHCHRVIDRLYYHVNGNVLCGLCRTSVQSLADTPQGLLPLVVAGLFGLGAAIAGAVIYYGVIAIANLEIGIVAILIGYMVGYSVRKGARGHGGLRFQVLAVLLTYGSVALAYTPLVFKQALSENKPAENTQPTSATATGQTVAIADSSPVEEPRPTPGRALLSVGILLGLIAALPVLVVANSLPSGLISAFIILIGMRQAWKMTG